jgi:hypothetical protein
MGNANSEKRTGEETYCPPQYDDGDVVIGREISGADPLDLNSVEGAQQFSKSSVPYLKEISTVLRPADLDRTELANAVSAQGGQNPSVGTEVSDVQKQGQGEWNQTRTKEQRMFIPVRTENRKGERPYK